MHELATIRSAFSSFRALGRRAAQTSLLFCAALLSVTAQADQVTDGRLLISKGDVAGGLKLLEQATADGNLSAKGVLAQALLSLAPPFRDTARACRLAGEASAAGNTMGHIALADCLIAGESKTDDPYEAARVLARKAVAAGSAEGGFELYKIYVLDPKYSYIKDGKADQAKYDELAARPATQRSVQIEAFNALSGALANGNYAALNSFIAYLSVTTAPSNIDRLLHAAGFLRNTASIVPLQPNTQKAIQTAQSIRQMGVTNVSQKVILEVSPTLTGGAAAAISRKLGSSCDANTVKLKSIAAEPVANAEYLPLKGIMSNTYMLRGTWNENWIYAGCDTEVEYAVTFSADGGGGATYTAKLSASK